MNTAGQVRHGCDELLAELEGLEFATARSSRCAACGREEQRCGGDSVVPSAAAAAIDGSDGRLAALRTARGAVQDLRSRVAALRRADAPWSAAELAQRAAVATASSRTLQRELRTAVAALRRSPPAAAARGGSGAAAEPALLWAVLRCVAGCSARWCIGCFDSAPIGCAGGDSALCTKSDLRWRFRSIALAEACCPCGEGCDALLASVAVVSSRPAALERWVLHPCVGARVKVIDAPPPPPLARGALHAPRAPRAAAATLLPSVRRAKRPRVSAPPAVAPPALRPDARLTLVLGATASGKTACLTALCDACDGPCVRHHDAAAVQWSRGKAIASHFGGPVEAKRWLGCVGLHSIPTWCRPHHALSTGEAYRAQLARVLQRAANLVDDAKGSGSSVLLCLDDFAVELDELTAKCVARGLSRCFRREPRLARVRLVVASVDHGIAPWLCPDAVVLARAGSALVAAPVACATAPATIRIAPAALPVAGSAAPAAAAAAHAATATAEPDPGGAPPTVLHATVSRDECTDMCSSFFDFAFDGRTSTTVPSVDFNAARTIGGRIGVIFGRSGTAKSVLMREHFGEPTRVCWSAEHSVGAHFSSPTLALECAAAVGIDAMLLERAHSALSRGERHLADIARLLEQLARGQSSAEQQREGPLIVDEFAIGLDACAARSLGAGINAFVAALEPRPDRALMLLLVACRCDFIDHSALVPDWIVETGVSEVLVATAQRFLARKRGTPAEKADPLNLDKFCSEAMPLLLELRPCAAQRWDEFKSHHYKSEALSVRAQTFVAVLLERGAVERVRGCGDEEPVGFVAAIPHIGWQRPSGEGGDGSDAARVTWRAHRTVVLPHWQGLGLGGMISDAVAELHHRAGLDYMAQTVHPRLGAQRDASPLWRALPWNHTMQRFKTQSWRQRKRNIVERLPQPRMIFAHCFEVSEE